MSSNNNLPIIPSTRVWQDLGISRGTGRRLLTAGLLCAVHLGGRLYITRDSLDLLMQKTLLGEAGSPHLHKRGRKRRYNRLSSTSSIAPTPVLRPVV
jgi:hypothetical protein